MTWTRWLIFLIPAATAALTYWSAEQASLSRRARQDEVVVASGEGIAPTLHPFLPTSEVDRQVSALVHAPLIQIGESGDLEGVLAESWKWSQTSSFWFANEGYAKAAADKIRALTPEQWTRWQLTAAEPQGTELRLQCSGVSTRLTNDIREEIASEGPLPVETIRVDLAEDARSHHEYFVQSAVEGSQIKGVWFDGPKSYELKVSGETVRFFQELELYYRNHPSLQAKLRVIRREPMLIRPTLEVVLREGAQFHDGNAVTAADVEATAKLVLSQPWSTPGREALRLIEDWDTTAPRYLRIRFRGLYGPAITSLVGLPILPRWWIGQQLEKSPGATLDFRALPPPGAGEYRLEGVTQHGIYLKHRQNGTGVQFLLDQSARDIRSGFGMKVVDAFWPDTGSLEALSTDPAVTLYTPAPRSRLLVLWNCQKFPVEDPATRKALGMAVDRTALVQKLLQGHGTIHEGIFQPGLWFSRSTTPALPDLVGARQVLYGAGWSKGPNGKLMKGGQPFRLELLTVANNPTRQQLAEWLKASWEPLGVEVTVTDVPWEEMLDNRLPSRQFDAALIGLDFETTWDQSIFWHSSQRQRGLNFSGVNDRALDDLLNALRLEQEPGRIATLAHAMEDRLLSLHPFFPLFSGGTPLALRKDPTKPEPAVGNAGAYDLRQVLRSWNRD